MIYYLITLYQINQCFSSITILIKSPITSSPLKSQAGSSQRPEWSQSRSLQITGQS